MAGWFLASCHQLLLLIHTTCLPLALPFFFISRSLFLIMSSAGDDSAARKKVLFNFLYITLLNLLYILSLSLLPLVTVCHSTPRSFPMVIPVLILVILLHLLFPSLFLQSQQTLSMVLLLVQMLAHLPSVTPIIGAALPFPLAVNLLK